MKLFLKRAGFLLLMAVMGVLSLLVHLTGYPFAWRFHADQAYWLPLAYGLDLLCVIAVLSLVFWGLRGFLFGRGRPWLAWLSIGAWVLVWSALVWFGLNGRAAHWRPIFVVGERALSEQVAALQQQTWSPGMIQSLPPAQRETVCSKAVLKEESSTAVEREGFPTRMDFPADMADKGLFDTDACPAERVRQYRTLRSQETQLKASIRPAAETFASGAAQAVLLAHPDAILHASDLYRKHKDDPVAKSIAFNEFRLRLHTNGQVHEHQWEELPGQFTDGVKKKFIDPRIWRHDNAPDSDTWNFWLRGDLADGDQHLELWIADCKNDTVEPSHYIVKSASGQTELVPNVAEAIKARPGTWGAEWLQKVCSGKDKQVRMSDEEANRKFGG